MPTININVGINNIQIGHLKTLTSLEIIKNEISISNNETIIEAIPNFV